MIRKARASFLTSGYHIGRWWWAGRWRGSKKDPHQESLLILNHSRFTWQEETKC